MFKRTWHEIIKKLEDGTIDARGASVIYNSFLRDALLMKMSMPRSKFTWEILQEEELIHSKLVVALEMARTRYKLQSKSLWVRIFESIAGMILKVPTPSTKIAEKPMSNPRVSKNRRD